LIFAGSPRRLPKGADEAGGTAVKFYELRDNLARVVPASYRDIFRFVRRRVASVEDAEDTTQEVFADAAEALAKDG